MFRRKWRRLLAALFAVSLILGVCCPSLAADSIPGSRSTVNPGIPVTEWTMPQPESGPTNGTWTIEIPGSVPPQVDIAPTINVRETYFPTGGEIAFYIGNTSTCRLMEADVHVDGLDVVQINASGPTCTADKLRLDQAECLDCVYVCQITALPGEDFGLSVDNVRVSSDGFAWSSAKRASYEGTVSHENESPTVDPSLTLPLETPQSVRNGEQIAISVTAFPMEGGYSSIVTEGLEFIRCVGNGAVSDNHGEDSVNLINFRDMLVTYYYKVTALPGEQVSFDLPDVVLYNGSVWYQASPNSWSMTVDGATPTPQAPNDTADPDDDWDDGPTDNPEDDPDDDADDDDPVDQTDDDWDDGPTDDPEGDPDDDVDEDDWSDEDNDPNDEPGDISDEDDWDDDSENADPGDDWDDDSENADPGDDWDDDSNADSEWDNADDDPDSTTTSSPVADPVQAPALQGSVLTIEFQTPRTVKLDDVASALKQKPQNVRVFHGETQVTGPLATGDTIQVRGSSKRLRLVVMGDVTGNGSTGITDVVRVASALANGSSEARGKMLAADFDHNGVLSLTDLVRLAHLLVQL